MMSMPLTDLPNWRSLLFVPITREKFVATAHTRGADAIILDLEDSVPEEGKQHGRELISGRGQRGRAKLAPKFWFGSIDPGITLSATSRPR